MNGVIKKNIFYKWGKIYFGPQERALEIFKPNAIQKALKNFGLWLKPNLSKKLNKT